MDEQRQQRIEELARAALAQPPSARTAYLDRQCDGDDALRRKVEALLEPPAIYALVAAANRGQPVTQTIADGRSLHPQKSLESWGPFRLIERVGFGGFGEVYRAWDPTLEREVALKLLLPGTGPADQSKSILSEARLLARVRHPNVVSVFGVDQHDGRVGFWSDFVRGNTLSKLLELQGPFGAREAALMGIEIARGISAVHAAGLLHRDIKTGNVMREEGGRIVLMDFGLTQERDGEHLWGGTPHYMAPELLAGEPPSVATDIYAFGVLLFHVLTRKYPFEGANLREMMTAHQSQARRRLMDERPDLPEQLAQVVETAIDSDPKKRYSSVGHMRAALSESVGLTSGSIEFANPTMPPKKRRLSRRWVASCGAASLAALYFSTSARDLLPSGTVAGRISGAYTDYLNAQELLDNYYKPGNLVKAVALFRKSLEQDSAFALAHAGLGRAWFLQYRDAQDAKLIPAIQAECLSALAQDRKLASAHVTLGMLYTQTGKNDLAMQELNEALRLDASNAEAYGALAELHPKQGRDGDVEPALQKAVDLAPGDWRWPNLLGLHYLSRAKLDQAMEQFQLAVRLTPDNPRPYNNLGIVYRRMNRLTDARAAYEESIRLEPTFNRLANLGRLQQDEGKLSEAVATYKGAIDMNPASYITWGNLASVYLRMSDGQAQARETYLKAIAVAEGSRKDRPKDAGLLAILGSFYAIVGDPAKSLPALRQAAALAPNDSNVLYRVSEGYELLQRRDDALRWIARAVDAGLSVKTIESNPELAQLRADPRFLAARKKLR